MIDYRNDTATYVFADTEAAMVRMLRTAEAAGCRIIAALSVGEEPPNGATPGALILVELENEAAAEEAMPLLHWLRCQAESGGRRGVISAPVGLIDLVAVSADHAGIEHLCGADEAERLAAIGRAGVRAASRVYDDGGAGTRVLQRAPDYALDPAGPADLLLIRAVVRARRLRDEHFPDDLFADPAWDILLDLMAARLERKQVTVSSLCIAAAVPPTTALRWISVLTERGMVVRVADSADRRRAFVELSDATARALLTWLRRARRLAAETL
jgi:hypothetical protein